MSTNFPGSPYMMGFVEFSREMGDEFSCLFPYYGKLMREAMLFLSKRWFSSTGWKSNGKNHPFYGKSMGTSFTEFSNAMGIWWQKPCIFHAMKHTIGWEYNEKRQPYYEKSMSTNFRGSPHTMGFVEYYREPIS